MSINLLLNNLSKILLIKKFNIQSCSYLNYRCISNTNNLVQFHLNNIINCKCNDRRSTFIRSSNFVYVRFKYNSAKKSNSRNQDEDFDNDDETEDFQDERDSKIVKTRVNSLRADLIVKAGLGIARNKVETIFYESKVRVNGLKIPKKSIQLNVGDEIDIIRGFSNVNPTHLMISRVIVLSATEKEENILVNLRRYKSLVIENYEGSNQWKCSE